LKFMVTRFMEFLPDSFLQSSDILCFPMPFYRTLLGSVFFFLLKVPKIVIYSELHSFQYFVSHFRNLRGSFRLFL
jgi:hypothetical protein